MLQKLEWDSVFFGVPVFSVEVDRDSDLEELNKVEKPCLVYISLNEDNAIRRDEVEKLGSRLYGRRIVYKKYLGGVSLKDISNEIKEYKGEINDELVKLSLRAGKHSRFHKDKKLFSYYNRFYKTWIVNSINKTIADKVFVYEEKGVVEGVVTCKLSGGAGWLGLISVSYEFEGKGAGKSLLRAAEKFYLQNSIIESFAVTQKANIRACRFYESAGYKIDKQQLVFHLWRE